MSSKIALLSSGYEMPLTGYSLWDVSKAACADQDSKAIKEVLVWDMTITVLQEADYGPSNEVHSLCPSLLNGKLLFSVSKEQAIKIWSIETGTCYRTLTGHSGSVYSVAISPNGRLLASGGTDNNAMLWETLKFTLCYTLGHSSWVHLMAFSPDSKFLVTNYGGGVKVWNNATGALQWSQDGRSHTEPVSWLFHRTTIC
ncbi:hypothetical protein PENANT_c005G03295 [Penicillium antarcticum]|uniref:Mitochondrial division protein 1 n=1 Tax=Penicillium antarcticum TaxID=416450 RepID=A0A1V6QEM4_9EURO|nr:hypothetical protein PENANT_c005G03295 [Penicillium antarcticum]